MTWRECLTKDTAVIYIYRFVCQSIQTFVSSVKCWDCNFMTDSGTFCRICVNCNRTFINNCFKFIFDLCIKHFTKMFCTESGIECIFADSDTEHIPLAGVINSLNTVNVVVEFTFDNRFKVRLHLLTCNFNYISKTVFTAFFKSIYLRTYNCDLVVFYFIHILCLYKFCTVYT